MTRTMLFLSVAAISFLLHSFPVHCQEPDGPVGVRAQLAEAERDVKLHELELNMAELAVDDAMVESQKTLLRVEAAKKQGDSLEVGQVQLELKQATIRVEMQKLQREMARLQMDRAKAALERIRAEPTEKPGKPTRVQVEYLDDSEVVVIRGAKADVEKIRALIEGAKNDTNEKE